MQPTLENSKYPVFEANQILTNLHLNRVFNYLDEQERLTRANLIGIGIVCGLEVSLGGTTNAPVVRIGKGCGVTSQGYLIVEPAEVELESYRLYQPPADVAYPLFVNIPLSANDLLWEMFPEGEPNTTPFSATPGFLDDKVVLLFLELKKEGLRNCSPANCDDRGAEVTVTVRRLLVRKNDARMARLIDGTIGVNSQVTTTHLEEEMLAKLNLPDIRLPRFNVPAGLLTSSNAVYAGFLSVFRDHLLVSKTSAALTSAYDAFKPLIGHLYTGNPFSNFSSLYGFLDNAPQNTVQVRFLQYYYDLFDDLLKAYEEFRWKGAELMCACCPPEGLFPRHLLLGLVHPESDTGAVAYRHHFRASSAISGCEALTEELHLLFRRLVEMTRRFSNDPPLLTLKGPGNTASYVRITPSKLGDVPLGEKCIPYYYLQNGTPRLFELWNAERSRRNRAHHNLSYRYFEYDAPSTPDFVATPLLYDLEPHNFLRIEGHINKPFGLVLNQLLTLKAQYRLPVDIIALRTGAFDENMPVDLTKEQCRFRDLESLYDATREQWLSRLCKELTAMYYMETTAVPPTSPNPDRKFFTSKYAFINKYAPGFKVDPHKIGGRYEMGLSPGSGLPSVVFKAPGGQPNYDPLFYKLFDAILAMADSLSQDLTGFNYATFDARYKTFQGAAETLEQDREDPALLDKMTATSAILVWEEIDDRLEDLLYHCRSDAFKAINDEYARRIKEVKQKQFLSNFLLKHPGIQHKAGVPLGGTFILVYHDDPEITFPKPPTDVTATAFADDVAVNFSEEVAGQDVNYAARTGLEPIITKEVEESFKKIQLNPLISLDPDVRTLIAAFSGQITNPRSNFNVFFNEPANQIISSAVNELTDGTVIADFFLPYLCCSDCAGVQYVLPAPQPTFTYTVGCTNDNDQAEVTLITHGGAPPYSYKVDSLAYSPLNGVVALKAGEHTVTIRDADGTESLPQTIRIAGKIVAGTPQYACDSALKNFQAKFNVNGGTAPYTASSGSIAVVGSDNVYTSPFIPTGTEVEIVITDSKGCTLKKKVTYACPLPLDFEVALMCTNINKLAQANFDIHGGEAPYQIFVDGKKIDPLKKPELTVGEHTVAVLDAKGNEKSKKITVPDPLLANVNAATYVCSPDLKTYTVRISVSGGTPPYALDVPVVLKSDNSFTVGPIPSGPTRIVKIKDAKGCETSVPVQYQCLQKQPSVNIGLSAVGANNRASVTINPEGGEPPYFYRVNSGAYAPVDQKLALEPGEYTITIRDSKGVESVPQKIVVPPATPSLQLQPVDYRCENGLYVIALKVSGGQPPYKLLKEGIGQIRADNTFVSAPVPGGQPLTVEIGDSAGQKAGSTYVYECEPACDKPCGGLSRRCSYPLWLQPGVPFESYRPGAVEFTFTDEKKKTQSIPGLSVNVTPEVLNTDFHGAMKALIAQINDKVGRVLGPGRLVLSYEFRDGDPFARLWIESFECEMFNMRFSYTYAQGGSLKDYEARYMKAGNVNAAVFTNLQADVAPVQVPAFDCSVRDQCKRTELQKICTERLPQIAFGKAVSGDQIILTANTSGVGISAFVQWIWEVERSTEMFYSGSQVVVKVPNLSRTGTTVKLIGLTKQGCFVTATDKISPLTK